MKHECSQSPDGFHHDKSKYNKKWNDMTVRLFNKIRIWFLPENYNVYLEEPGKCIFCSKRFSKFS